jgi:hypothetical protein
MPEVICQEWEESENEPGWGVTVRPDGFSLHKSEEDRQAFIKAYWDKCPSGPAPASYSRPSGQPYFVNLRSNSKLYQALLKSRKGVRQDGKPPAGYRKVS